MATYAAIIEGLQILAKYEDKGLASHVGGAEHDVFYAGSCDKDKVSPEDLKRLEELGWYFDEEVEGFLHFV